MALRNHTRFKGFQNLGKSLLTTELENNLKVFLDWCFLGVGGWFSVTGANHPGPYGGDESLLRLVDDPQYSGGQVWEGHRKEWVWETGVEWTGSDTPNRLSGVYVDDTFYGTGDATYGHHYNYPLGRVVFENTTLPTTAKVQATPSYRWVQVYRSVDAQWWRELQPNSFRVDNAHFTQQGSGAYDILAHHRVQMPCVVVEAVSVGRSAPYEIGNGSLIMYRDMRFHVYAETAWERNQIIDALSYQDDKNIWMYDTDEVVRKGDHSLDHRGMLVGTKNYPDFVDTTGNGGSRHKTMRFTDTIISEIAMHDPRLHEGVVRTTAEVIVGAV